MKLPGVWASMTQMGTRKHRLQSMFRKVILLFFCMQLCHAKLNTMTPTVSDLKVEYDPEVVNYFNVLLEKGKECKQVWYFEYKLRKEIPCNYKMLMSGTQLDGGRGKRTLDISASLGEIFHDMSNKSLAENVISSVRVAMEPPMDCPVQKDVTYKATFCTPPVPSQMIPGGKSWNMKFSNYDINDKLYSSISFRTDFEEEIVYSKRRPVNGRRKG